MRTHPERIPASLGGLCPLLEGEEGVNMLTFSAKNASEGFGRLSAGHPSLKPARFSGLKSTLSRIPGPQEEVFTSAARAALTRDGDKYSPRSTLQRSPKSRGKRAFCQNTLNFSFRGLANWVNYTSRLKRAKSTRYKSPLERHRLHRISTANLSTRSRIPRIVPVRLL